MYNDRAGVKVKSVARAIDILNCFSRNAELGISEIANMLGLSKSTVFGMVNTLTAYSFLEQLPGSKRYRLGISLFEFGHLVQSRMDARREASVICQSLAQKYPATVHLGVPSNNEVIYVDKIENTNALVVYSQIGKRAPLYCTGIGKVILANMPIEYVDAYLATVPLVKLTENTITDKDILLKQLEEIRSEGVAIDKGEIEPGLNCVAAPVFNHLAQPQMAISISFPLGRIKEFSLEDIKINLLTCAKKVSEYLGYFENH
jgi:DNA-binding IclR family transcriptional regulator